MAIFVWPIIHAFLAALITTWDVLPPTSKAYDMVPNHIVARLGKNATLDRVVTEWVRDTWRWGEPALNPSVALTWVNGINYTNEEMEEQARFLSSLFGCRVRPYYNPSLGWWLRDLTRVSFMYIRSPTEDPVVTGLAKHLSMVLREVGPKGRVVHLAHSGGALLTYLVAKYHLMESDRRRIDVINFGGARSITRKYFGKATNYYARNDPILLVNRRAMHLMQQLLNESADGEVIYLKHNTSFVFLQGRSGDRFADHSLVGPTYLTALNKEAAAFRRSYYRAYWLEGLTVAKPPEMGWGRFVRKRVAAATGFHNYFSNSTVVRLYYDGGRGREGGAASTWTNATNAALRLPKRFRKYVRKKYFKLRGLPYVSAKKSGKVKIIVPIKVVQQQQLQRHQQQQQQHRSSVRIRPLPSPPSSSPPSSSFSSSSSRLVSWMAANWKHNNSQSLALVVPPPRSHLFSLSSWFGNSRSSGSSIPAIRGSGSDSSMQVWMGRLTNKSMTTAGKWAEETKQRVRVVRKTAARWTGRRHFFAGREERERLLARESERAAAMVAEAEKAAKGHPFLFFLRGNSGIEKGVVVEEEEERRMGDVRKTEEEKEKVATAAMDEKEKEEEGKKEMRKKVIKDVETRRKEEEEEENEPVAVAADTPESEGFTILPPEAAESNPVADEMPSTKVMPMEEEEEGKREGEKEEMETAETAAVAATTAVEVPKESNTRGGGEEEEVPVAESAAAEVAVTQKESVTATGEEEKVQSSRVVETEESEAVKATEAEISSFLTTQEEEKGEEEEGIGTHEREKEKVEGGEEHMKEGNAQATESNQAVGQS
ncbi:Hypothetical protein NocV09_00601780 [Nannochloropsis oceanica]